jgi:hypothetical protein
MLANTPEEPGSAAHLVSNDKTPLTSAFDFKYFHYRTIATLGLPHDLLVHPNSMRARSLEERSVGDSADVGTSIRPSRGWGRKVALGNEIAVQLFSCCC